MQLRRRLHADAAASRFRPLSSARRGNEEDHSLSSEVVSANSSEPAPTQNLDTGSRASAAAGTVASSNCSPRPQASRNSHRAPRTRGRGTKTSEGGRGAGDCRSDSDGNRESNKQEAKREREDREETDSLDSSSLAANTPVACRGRRPGSESQSSAPRATKQREGGGANSSACSRSLSTTCGDSETLPARQLTERVHLTNFEALPSAANATWRHDDEEGKRRKDEGMEVVQEWQGGGREEEPPLDGSPSADVNAKTTGKKTRPSISAASSASCTRRRISSYTVLKPERDQAPGAGQPQHDSMESPISSRYPRRRLEHTSNTSPLPCVAQSDWTKKASDDSETTAAGRRSEAQKESRDGWNPQAELRPLVPTGSDVSPSPSSASVSYSPAVPSSFLSPSPSPACTSAPPSSQPLPRDTSADSMPTAAPGFSSRLANPSSPPAPYFWLPTSPSPSSEALSSAPSSLSSSSSRRYSLLKDEKPYVEQPPWNASCAPSPARVAFWKSPAGDNHCAPFAEDNGPRRDRVIQQPSSAGLRLPRLPCLPACVSCSWPGSDRTGSSLSRRHGESSNNSAKDSQSECQHGPLEEAVSKSRDSAPETEPMKDSNPGTLDSRRSATPHGTAPFLQHPRCHSASTPEYRVSSLLRVSATRERGGSCVQNHSGEPAADGKFDASFGVLPEVHCGETGEKERHVVDIPSGGPQQVWDRQDAQKGAICSSPHEPKDEIGSGGRRGRTSGQEEQDEPEGEENGGKEGFFPVTTPLGSDHLSKSATTPKLEDPVLHSHRSSGGQQSAPLLGSSVSGKSVMALDAVPSTSSLRAPMPCASTSHTDSPLEENLRPELLCSEMSYDSSSERAAQAAQQKAGHARRSQSSYAVEYPVNGSHSSGREKTCSPTIASGIVGTASKSPKGSPSSPCEGRTLPSSLPQLPFPNHSPPGLQSSSNYMSLLPTLLQPSFPLFQASASSAAASPPSSKDTGSCPLPHQESVALLPPSRVGMLDSPSLSAPAPPMNSFPSSSSFSASLGEPFALGGHSFPPSLDPPPVSSSPLQNPNESLFVMAPNGNAPGRGGPHPLLGAGLAGQGGSTHRAGAEGNLFLQNFPLNLASGSDLMAAGPLALEPRGSGDGRLMLEQLDVLRSGASKDLYKRERTRVVDELIRQAVTYPKVSGIYFDKHQLRWSVGWAQHGRRVAKYFPVKIFGLAEGYRLAVHFKQAAVASAAANASALSSTASVIDPSSAFNSLSSLAVTQSPPPGPTASPVGLTPFLPSQSPPCPPLPPGGANDLPLAVQDLQRIAGPGLDGSGRGLSTPQPMPPSCGVPPVGQGSPADLLKQDSFLLQHVPVQNTEHTHSPAFASLRSLPHFQDSVSLPDLAGDLAGTEPRERQVTRTGKQMVIRRTTECSEEKRDGTAKDEVDAVTVRERERGDLPPSNRNSPVAVVLPFQQDAGQEPLACHSPLVVPERGGADPGAASLCQLSTREAPRESCVSSGDIKGPSGLEDRKPCLSHDARQLAQHEAPRSSTVWNGGEDTRAGAFVGDCVSATAMCRSLISRAAPTPFDADPSVCCPQTDRAKPGQGGKPGLDGEGVQRLGEQKRGGGMAFPLASRGAVSKARTEARRADYEQRPPWESSTKKHSTARHVTAGDDDEDLKAGSPQGKSDRVGEKEAALSECFDGPRSHPDSFGPTRQKGESFRKQDEERDGKSLPLHQARGVEGEEDLGTLSTGRDREGRGEQAAAAEVEKKFLDEKREEVRKRRREDGTCSDDDPTEEKRAPRALNREGQYHSSAVHNGSPEAPLCRSQVSLPGGKGGGGLALRSSRQHAPPRRSESGSILAAAGSPDSERPSPGRSPTAKDGIKKQRGPLPQAEEFLSAVTTQIPKPDGRGDEGDERHSNEKAERAGPAVGGAGKHNGISEMLAEEEGRCTSRSKARQPRTSLARTGQETGDEKVPSSARPSDFESSTSPEGGTGTHTSCSPASRLRSYSASFPSSPRPYYCPSGPASADETRCPELPSNNVPERGAGEQEADGLSRHSCPGASPPTEQALRSQQQPPVLQHASPYLLPSPSLQVATDSTSCPEHAPPASANDEADVRSKADALGSTSGSSFSGLCPPCAATTASVRHLHAYPDSSSNGAEAPPIVHQAAPTNSTNCSPSPAGGGGIAGLFGHERGFSQGFSSAASTFSSPPSTVSSPLSAPPTALMSVITPSTSVSSLSPGTAPGCEIPSSRQPSQSYACHQLPTVPPCGVDSASESACRLVSSATTPPVSESSGPPPLLAAANSAGSSNSGAPTTGYYPASNLDPLEGAPSVPAPGEWGAPPAPPSAAMLNPSVNAAFMRGLQQNHAAFNSFPLALPLHSDGPRSLSGSSVGCPGLLGTAGTLLTHTTGIHFDKHSLRWKATWYDTTGQRKAKYFPVGKYGYDQARRLAIQARQANHVPRSSRFAAAHAQQQVQLQQLLLHQQLLGQHHPCMASGPGPISAAPPALLSGTPPVSPNLLMTASHVTGNSSLGGNQSCPRSDWAPSAGNANSFLKDAGSLHTNDNFGDGTTETAGATSGRGSPTEDRGQQLLFRSQISQKDSRAREAGGSFGYQARLGLQHEPYYGEAHAANTTALQDTTLPGSVCSREGASQVGAGDTSCRAFAGTPNPFFASCGDMEQGDSSRRSSGERSAEGRVATSRARGELQGGGKSGQDGGERRTEENEGEGSGIGMAFPCERDDEGRQELGSPAAAGGNRGGSLASDLNSGEQNAEGGRWEGGEERDGEDGRAENKTGEPDLEAGSLNRQASGGEAEDEEFKELLLEEEYDEEKDKRLSQEPSRVLIRHASRLPRVSGIWFDKKQLRWACTFTDAVAGKRRAEYFPIRHFGFFGARRLAIQARRRMEKLRQEQKMQSHLSHAHFQEQYEHHQQQHPSTHSLLQHHQHFLMHSRPGQQVAMNGVLNAPLCASQPHPAAILHTHSAEGPSAGVGGHTEGATAGLGGRGSDLPHLQRQQLMFLQLLEQTQHEHQRMNLGEGKGTTEGAFSDIQAAARLHGETTTVRCSFEPGDREAEKPCLQQVGSAAEQPDNFKQSFPSCGKLRRIAPESKEEGEYARERDTVYNISQQRIHGSGNGHIGAGSLDTVQDVQSQVPHGDDANPKAKGTPGNVQTQSGSDRGLASESSQVEAEMSLGGSLQAAFRERQRDREHEETRELVGSDAVQRALRRNAGNDDSSHAMVRRPQLRESAVWLATTGGKSQSGKESPDTVKTERRPKGLQLDQSSVSVPVHVPGALPSPGFPSRGTVACDKVSPVFAGEALEDQTQRHCKSPSAAKPSSEAPDCDGARSSLFSRRTGKEEERNLQHLQQKPGKEEEQDEARGVKEDPESRGLVLQKPGDGTTSGAVPNLLETCSASRALALEDRNASLRPVPASLPPESAGESHQPEEVDPSACEKDGAPLLTLERQAIRFLLLDLKNKCLANLAPLLLPAIFQRHYGHLVNHIRRVEYAISCEGLESFLLIFADCIKTMSLPSQLGVAEQVQMMGLVAALGEQLDAQGL